MATDTLQIEGMPVSDVFNQIKGAGISDAEASILVGNWLIANGGNQQRIFSYKTDFPATVPGCGPTFNRTFQHQDWVDGESVVQAQQTTGEDGFNVRFHKIEKDLDSLKADDAQAFACIAAMRAEIRELLDEIRAQINLINSDLYNNGIFSGGFQRLPVGVSPPPGQFTFDAANTKFLGATKYFDKDVNVWQTSQGTLILPTVAPVAINPATDPRVTGPAALAKFVSVNPGIQAFFANNKPVTKADLVKNFGTQQLDNGLTVADAVNILPDNASFANLDAMATDVAERQAGAIRTAPLGTESLAATLGVANQPGNLGTAPVKSLSSVPEQARAALAAAGIDTVSKLATAKPAEITTALTKAGVASTAGDIAAWTTVAKTINRI